MKPHQLQEFEKILNEAKELAKRKSSDYSDDVPVDNISVLGLEGVFCRMTDKWARLYSLIWIKKNPQVKSEKTEDTLIDLLVYCVIALIVMRNKWDTSLSVGVTHCVDEKCPLCSGYTCHATDCPRYGEG